MGAGMAVIFSLEPARRMLAGGFLACTLLLAGCGQTGTNVAAPLDANVAIGRTLAQTLSATLLPAGLRRTPAGDGFTATRASLTAAGFAQPLLVVTLTEPRRRAGLLVSGESRGTRFWTGGDGGTVKTRGGVLAGTEGLAWDLYTAETAPTEAALAAQGAQGYRKVYRLLDGKSTVVPLAMDCTMTSEGGQVITVFDRTHRVTAFVERCTAVYADVLGVRRQIQNRYWRDPASGVLWRSEQWISPKMGLVTLERVFL